MPLSILFQDRHLVVVHKPPNMLLHRTAISRDRTFVLQTLRNQLGRRVYPIHRLDRAVSGVLAFGLDSASAQRVAAQFEARTVSKEYWALARGWVDDSGMIDHPVSDEESGRGARQALTRYRCLQRVELPYRVDRYPSTRYSLVEVEPLTGRRQQIRKHFKHISHHLVGDTTHGNGRHNRFFRERYGIHRLMLSARRLCFDHPATGARLCVEALPEGEWRQLFLAFGWDRLFSE